MTNPFFGGQCGIVHRNDPLFIIVLYHLQRVVHLLHLKIIIEQRCTLQIHNAVFLPANEIDQFASSKHTYKNGISGTPQLQINLVLKAGFSGTGKKRIQMAFCHDYTGYQRKAD